MLRTTATLVAMLAASAALPGAARAADAAACKTIRMSDPGWTDIVRWTLNVLILAEEAGITRESVERAMAVMDELDTILPKAPGEGTPR